MRKRALVTAELGINHNGSIETLKELADMSFSAGADYVKIQMRTPEICVPEHMWNKPRTWQGKEMRYIDYKREIELSEDELWEFDTYVKRHYGTSDWGRSRWFPSVWDIPSLERASQFNIPFVKVPSALITDKLLMSAVRDTHDNIIISTGMSTKDEVYRAIDTFDINQHLIVMHCCSAYPCSDEDINLSVIARGEDPNLWGSVFEGLLYGIAWGKGSQDELSYWHIGFSSHSPSPYPAIYASLLGAAMVEVHVTLNRAMEGSDHAASLEKPGLRLLCREVERIPVLWGEPIIKVQDSELDKRRSLRGV